MVRTIFTDGVPLVLCVYRRASAQRHYRGFESVYSEDAPVVSLQSTTRQDGFACRKTPPGVASREAKQLGERTRLSWGHRPAQALGIALTWGKRGFLVFLQLKQRPIELLK